MVNEKCLPYTVTALKKEDFFTRPHRDIFEAIVRLYKEGLDVDIVTVSDRLQRDSKLDFVGGRAYINDLALDVVTTSNYKSYIKIILDYSKRRQLKELASDILAEADSAEEVDKLLVSTSATATKILTRNEDEEIPSIAEGAMEVYEDLVRVYESGEPLGIPLQFPTLTKWLGGLQGGKVYILAGRPAMGKGYGLDTLTLTPTGWVKNRDLKVGSIVVGRDGKPTKVIGVYPQPLQPCYKMTLKDGREIITDAPHQWAVDSCKWNGRKVLTTEELYNKLKCVRYQNRISLPKFSGDYGAEKDFIIPPYVMGVLIGDGCLTKGLMYCKPNLSVFKKVKELLPKQEVHFGKDNKTVYINNFIDGLKYIRQVGLTTQSYNKFIPKEYFHSSLKQRTDLFNGLMDTDGHTRGQSSWEYSTVSKQLAKDVQQLAWSLGYSCKIKERIGKYKKQNKTIYTRTNYRVFISGNKPLTITSIVPTDPIPTQCIAVDNEESLFVVEDYVVTHNTALALNIAEYVASQGDKNVLCFSLEMEKKEYAKRLMLKFANTNSYMINNGLVDEAIMDKLTQSLAYMSELALSIDDKTPCTPMKVELGIINMVNNKGSCDLVVIDYLQLMDNDTRTKDRQADISEISRKLKQLANKYNVPIICLSQLSRALEVREDKHPKLSDLRESGAIEQDADVVLFVYRGEYYEPENIDLRGRAEVIVAKQRDGVSGTIPFAFNGSKCEFKELQQYGGT